MEWDGSIGRSPSSRARRGGPGPSLTSPLVSKFYNGSIGAGGQVLVPENDAQVTGLGRADGRKGVCIVGPADIAHVLLSADKLLDY